MGLTLIIFLGRSPLWIDVKSRAGKSDDPASRQGPRVTLSLGLPSACCSSHFSHFYHQAVVAVESRFSERERSELLPPD
ncbi:hypothetical protein C4D60_Mb08t18150 [Musa balbisiana]|uniref:Uncharacterized protein n=1 Tax=Musa balbisiana TaxID=52838 RepID=A0A4S8K4P6_MUSBA|nr:hypothetical protein C4D60_Mb08t18150 [Musa balbisiana]